MKYIKAYENTEENIPLLKKYCIWKNTNDTLEILELVGSEKNKKYSKYMSLLSLYFYYPSENKLVKLKRQNQAQIAFDSNIIKTYVPYTSDNIQDCIDMLPIISNIEKYNI